MKKTLAIVLSIVTVLSCIFVLASCGEKTESDLKYVKDKGELVVGITDFAPMDYKENDSDEWVGYDADLAKAFAKSLGVNVKFVEIDWDYKVANLNSKDIDCVWNGMTITDEVKSTMEVSKAYCKNAQVIVVPADSADKYKNTEDCKELNFAVEKGSAGKSQAEKNGFKFIEVDKQSTAIQEVASKTSDAAIIDLLMAGAMIGEGTGFSSLTYTASLNSEEYGIGFRKGSDLAAKLNEFLAGAAKDGTIDTLANKYGVQEAVIKF